MDTDEDIASTIQSAPKVSSQLGSLGLRIVSSGVMSGTGTLLTLFPGHARERRW